MIEVRPNSRARSYRFETPRRIGSATAVSSAFVLLDPVGAARQVPIYDLAIIFGGICAVDEQANLSVDLNELS